MTNEELDKAFWLVENAILDVTDAAFVNVRDRVALLRRIKDKCDDLLRATIGFWEANGLEPKENKPLPENLL